MRRYCTLATVLVAVAAPAFAQGGGNGAPSGSHYNLNIIGVANPKTADLTGSNRHVIFVALGKPGANGQVTSRIYLTPGAEFRVCDGNAFDEATDCDGNVVAAQGAVFELPCNTNLDAGTDPDGEPSTLIACEAEDPQLAYEVWLRELGKPGGGMTMQTCATDVGQDSNGNGTTGEVVCSTENVVTLRDPGKEVFKNVTQQLTSLNVCFDTDPTADVDIDCFRYALFTNEFEDWHWQYDNRGLRLAQIRFYPIGS